MTEVVDTTYDRFANDPAYVAANEGFVRGLPLGRVTRILDLCGGTGAVGREGEILSKVIVHSLILTALMGVVAMLQAYVVPWMVPKL